MIERTNDFEVKVGLARMLAGGVIMDVTDAAQAKIAEDAGAVAVMALERVPSDIRKEGGVARMSPIEKIAEIREAVTIPVMAKVRIGHFVDFIDESEVLTPADPENHIEKDVFKVPFVCGATCLSEALRRIGEGAAMLRTKGEAGTGNIIEAVRHLRQIRKELRDLVATPRDEMMSLSKRLQVPYEVALRVKEEGKLPVPNFAAGGVATPADAALCMHLGAEAVFVGSGIFKSEDPARTARAIVRATAQYDDPAKLVEASRGVGTPMRGFEIEAIPPTERLATRGW